MSEMPGEKQRARTAKEKDRRRDSIVQSALELFLQKPGSLPTMTAIAGRAGVAKGTAYIYFDTKESIYLALLENELHSWLAGVTRELNPTGHERVDGVVNALMCFRQSQPNLWPLASLGHTVIETNIDSKDLLSYKTKLAQKYRSAARAIREHLQLPEKHSEAVEAALMQSYAYLLGNWQVSNPPASISRLLKGPNFRIMQPDFLDSSERGLVQLWSSFVEQQRRDDHNGGMLNRLFSRNRNER
ncbi:TetR/AcrR family transcriptional regulator [Aliidiomarina sp. Khilg15.8]